MSKEVNQVNHKDCGPLFNAAKALMNKSGLVKYESTGFVVPSSREVFEDYWKDEFDPQFGRYMAWILFAVGVENLIKAACVCAGVLSAQRSPRLGHYLSTDGEKGHLVNVLEKTDLGGDARCKLTKWHKHLTLIRNRDAHAYRANERDAAFSLVGDCFVPASGVLVEAMKRCNHPLSPQG